MSQFTKGSLVFAIIVGTSAMLAIFVVSELRASRSLADFSAYWTACRLFTSNPFDEVEVGTLQQDQAISNRGTLVMRNPPWTALFFFPYAYFSYPVATGLWIVSTVLLVFWSTLVLWRHLGGGPDPLPALALTFTFAPTFILVDLGQITAWLLASAAIFLITIDRRHEILAGIALIPFTFKPHISLLLLSAVLVWALFHKRWRLLISFTASMLALIGICLFLNVRVFTQYADLARSLMSLHWIYPNPSGALYEKTGIWAMQFLPGVLGFGLLLWRLRRMAEWDWKVELPLLLAVGVATSFYSYLYDEIVAVPLLLMTLVRSKQKLFWPLFAVANLLVYYYMRAGTLGQCWWTSSAWLIIAYVVARQSRSVTLGIAH